ncbi:type II toxin-antitoxin system YoeB family toxin [Cutibacterium avidum]|uniref:type II toxin-antitoxin system YoeB family toxin n=1 Tax=Cutibacterium avidum TaxID=33010 RepID=UPI001F4EE6EF|nr:type II toxin-antitoxin system YoeB family toxin [Cutibacterium avidum]MDK7698091.1 type II toxin-antitoxin system YoeB family toxin [Cutibacterium avidum]
MIHPHRPGPQLGGVALVCVAWHDSALPQVRSLQTSRGDSDYLGWQIEDRRALKSISHSITDIARNGNEGIGKPEVLSLELSGYWVKADHRRVPAGLTDIGDEIRRAACY